MPDGKSDFGGEYEVNIRRSHIAAYVLIAGLVLELIHAIVWFHGLETVVTMVAVLLIVAGVWGEVFFGNKARIAGDRQLAQYEARAAEANAKAVEAQLRLEQLKQPRMPDRAKFSKELEGVPPGKVEILYVKECSDCFWCAGWICAWFEGSGWTVTRLDPIPSPVKSFDGFPIAMSVEADSWGISVIAKTTSGSPSDAPADRAPWMAAFCALKSSLEPNATVNGKGSPRMPDGLVRVVVAPRP